MKIIQPGKLPLPQISWVVGQHTCPNCGTIYEIEASDAPFNISNERRPNGRSSMGVVCPFCGHRYAIERPAR